MSFEFQNVVVHIFKFFFQNSIKFLKNWDETMFEHINALSKRYHD
jgi:hypothetical protein